MNEIDRADTAAQALSYKDHPHPKVISVLKFFTISAGYLIVLLSLTDLLGLLFDLAALEAPKDPLLAATFLSLAFALVFSSTSFPSSAALRKLIVQIFLGAVFLLALIRFSGAIFHFLPNLDQILFGENFHSNPYGALLTTLNFIALGLAYHFIDFEYPNKLRPSQFLSLFVVFSSLSIVLGFLYTVRFDQDAKLTLKALIAMFSFILLALANLSLRPDQGFVALVTSDSTGGTLARRLLPACFFVSPFLGAIVIFGERCGIIHSKYFSLIFVIILNVIIFSGLIWWLAHILFDIDVKRKQAEDAVRLSSLTDELTGLYNRRGFGFLAEQQIRIAKRTHTCVMFFADMDGLKQVNDQFGHSEGDKALVNIAGILKNTFRESDVIARFSGDEFAVLCALENPAQMTALAERLTTAIALHRLKAPWVPYVLSLSFGVSFLTGNDATLEKLMLEADKKLYEIKEQKKKSPRP